MSRQSKLAKKVKAQKQARANASSTGKDSQSGKFPHQQVFSRFKAA